MHSIVSPTVDSPTVPKIALCLSGGGFRATLFHAGSLQRLNELGILSKITTICSVSGGSITNGVLATRWRELKATEDSGVLAGFRELIAEPLYAFCRQDLRTQVLLWDRINPINWPELLHRDKSVTDRLAAAYASELDLGVGLGSLPTSPAAPEFVFLATNLQNGGPWEFRRDRMGDWYTGFTAPGETSVAQAVAASSSYPVVFPPLHLTFDPPAAFRGGHGKASESSLIANVTLTDGGVYDNLGVEPVRAGFDFVLVSDGGHPLIDEELPNLAPFARVTRSLDIINNQVGAQRKRWLIEAFKSRDIDLAGAYWGLGSKVSNYGLPDAPAYPDELLPLLELVRTDLDPFTDGEIGVLVNQGYAVANAASLKWVSNLTMQREFDWPFGDWRTVAAARDAIRDSAEKGIARDLWQSIRARLVI